MRISFARSGGFAGIRLARSFDTASMPGDTGTRIENLVEAADFFGLPQLAAPSQPLRDGFEYRLAISTASQSREITVDDLNMPPSLRPLLDLLTSLVKSGGTP